MDLIKIIIDFLLHLDKYLGAIVQDYGILTYAILFLIILCETGLVITPFLPGDSLIFAAGAFAALGSLNVYWLFIILSAAAIIGDTINYWAGHFVGPKIFYKETGFFLNKKYLEQTRQFYEKHGGKTIIIARFLPIIRTFAPFVAGIGKMSYRRFISYNVFGGIFWAGLFSFGGYFFSTISTVKENFTLVIAAIILISFSPMLIEFFRHRKVSHLFRSGDAHQGE
jgi:membrane-associated protein